MSSANYGEFPNDSPEGIKNAKALAGRFASPKDVERNALIALLLSGKRLINLAELYFQRR